MKVIKVLPRGFGSNCFILTVDDKTAVVVDPADSGVLTALNNNNLRCEYVLLTHGHFDHVGGCAALCKNGARVYCGEAEKPLIFSAGYLSLFGGVSVPPFEVYATLKDGEGFSLCGINFKAIHTAGHTAGGMCYIADGKYLFAGDTLFRRGIGRTDLFSGNFAELLKSLKKIAALEGNYKVLCGHGDDTLLDDERLYNPYLRF